MKRDGFTLIEMVLATVLAATLLAAVLAVTANLSRERRRLDQSAANDAVTDQDRLIFSLLSTDLIAARSAHISADGRSTRLECVGGRDTKTFNPTARPCWIDYDVVASHCSDGSTHDLLVRRQRFVDDPSHPQSSLAIVAADVRRLDIAAADSLGDTSGERTGREDRIIDKLPPQMLLRIEFQSRTFERMLQRR